MAEKSFPWSGSTIGDCGPYSASDWSDWDWGMFCTESGAGTPGTGVLVSDGVVDGVLNVTGTASPVTVATGRALIRGRRYRNTSSVPITIPTPTTTQRIDRIILRIDYAAQTTRVVRLAGTEGGAAPTLMQIDGTLWEMSLAQVTIQINGSLVVTDERLYVHFRTRVTSAMLEDGAVSTVKIADLAVATGKVAASAITSAKIGDDQVTAAKLAHNLDGSTIGLNAEYHLGRHPVRSLARSDQPPPAFDDEFDSATLDPKWELYTTCSEWNVNTTWKSAVWCRADWPLEDLKLLQPLPSGNTWGFAAMFRGAWYNMDSRCQITMMDDDAQNQVVIKFHVYQHEPTKWECWFGHVVGGLTYPISAQPWSFHEQVCLMLKREVNYWYGGVSWDDYSYAKIGQLNRDWWPSLIEFKVEHGDSGRTQIEQYGIDWVRRDWAWI